MIIHYYKQFFPGPNSVGPRQPRELARRLAEAGHEVHVITNDFNAYNEAAEPDEHHRGESAGSWRVHRLPTPRNMRASLAARLRTYVTFGARAIRYGLTLPVPQVVIGSIQPLFAGLAALTVAKARGAPMLLEVRDLWPDALVVKGAISRTTAVPLFALADLLYRNAGRLVSLTPGIKKELVKKGVPAGRIDVLPNGFDPSLFALPPNAREHTRARYGWKEQFVALYAGTHTEVTAVDVIVRAAEALRDRPDIRFALFGQGQTKPAAMALAQRAGLRNVSFYDPVPKGEVPSLLAAADVCLMTLFHSPLIHIYFENKLMDYMGAGRAILAAMEGEQAEIIRRYQTGCVAPTFDHMGLARLVREAADGKLPLVEMGQRGQALVRERFLLPNILDVYVERVEAVATGRHKDLVAWEPVT